ncbi:hypothetical protein IV203_028498 [Nitzschia inconspicua]|uniref:Uncharacterized protein n=1 Tax=Nitzschia inconspicua TaxID=303405 RepID=A0A9K3LP12_9STRA|nr:hypothetical protein IV203_028498 [Nitzschia inconspicua]
MSAISLVLLGQFTNFRRTRVIGKTFVSYEAFLSDLGKKSHKSGDLVNLLSFEDDIIQNQSISYSSSNSKGKPTSPSHRNNTINATNELIETPNAPSNIPTLLSPEPMPPLECKLESNEAKDGYIYIQQYCCSTWDVSSDDWWLVRPDWDVSLENDTHYCFSPMEDKSKAAFLRELHTKQWDNVNCTDIEKSVEMNSGYGASTGWLMKAFWHALTRTHKPFQIIHNYRLWLYSTSNRSSWAYCDTEDSRCYFLPINPCNRTFYSEGREHSEAPAPRKNARLRDRLRFYWMSQYLFRRNHEFRHRLYQFRKQHNVEDIVAPCLTMHVRRGDAGLPRQPFRRYAAVQEYLDAVPNLTASQTIFLLTDDQSTIDEVQQYHSEKYDWRYLNRPRTQNIKGGFDGHLPSGDPAFEMLVLHTELEVASRCNRFVYGQSGFVAGMIQALDLEKRVYEGYYVNTAVSKEEARKFATKEARAEALLMDMKTRYYENNSTNSSSSDTSGQPPENKNMTLDEANRESRSSVNSTKSDDSSRQRALSTRYLVHDQSRRYPTSNQLIRN